MKPLKYTDSLKKLILDTTLRYSRMTIQELKTPYKDRENVQAKAIFCYCMTWFGFKDRETADILGNNRSQCSHYRGLVRENKYDLQDQCEIVLSRIIGASDRERIERVGTEIYCSLIQTTPELRSLNLSVSQHARAASRKAMVLAQAFIDEVDNISSDNNGSESRTFRPVGG